VTSARRVAVALLILQRVRDNIGAHGGRYSGAMAPNLQSVVDVLTMPDAFLGDQLTRIPGDMVPTPVEEAMLAAGWGDWRR
jgi:hypothetical protein